MNDNIIKFTREEVLILIQNAQREIDSYFKNLQNEVFCRGKTNQWIELMKQKLDRLEKIIHNESIKRFEESATSVDMSLNKTLNCPSILLDLPDIGPPDLIREGKLPK